MVTEGRNLGRQSKQHNLLYLTRSVLECHLVTDSELGVAEGHSERRDLPSPGVCHRGRRQRSRQLEEQASE